MTAAVATPTLREPVRTTRGVQTSDGAGVRLRRLLGGSGAGIAGTLDPFLMLDYFDSPDATDYIAGFPPHPHRGFQTVTYMLAGRMRHRDNAGHEGVIETGGVQWMTAGRGLVHSEMPEQQQGLMRGFQLWVNLPAKDKMSAPAYAEFGADRMPVEAREGASIKVVAGRTSQGTAGPIQTDATRAFFFDVALEAGGSVVEPLPAGASAFVVPYEGRVAIGGGSDAIAAVSLAVLGAGDAVRLAAVDGTARALVIGGMPLREPVAWHGPFVMNTQDEIVQAVMDFRAGKFGPEMR